MASAYTTRFFNSTTADAYDFAGLEARILAALPTSAKDLPVLLVVAVAVITGFLFTIQQKQPSLKHIPILGPEIGGAKARRDHFSKNGKDFLQRGYAEFKNKPFQIETSEGIRVVLGPEQMEEIRTKPDDVVDNRAPIMETLMAQYTKVPFADEVVLRSIKADLSTKLGMFQDR